MILISFWFIDHDCCGGHCGDDMVKTYENYDLLLCRRYYVSDHNDNDGHGIEMFLRFDYL